MIEYTGEYNDKSNRSYKSYVDFVDPYLINIFQLLDIAYNKTFHGINFSNNNYSMTKEFYNRKMKVGNKCYIPREILIDFICETIENLNKRHENTDTISKLFE